MDCWHIFCATFLQNVLTVCVNNQYPVTYFYVICKLASAIFFYKHFFSPPPPPILLLNLYSAIIISLAFSTINCFSHPRAVLSVPLCTLRPSPRELSEVFLKGNDGVGSVKNRTGLLAFFGQVCMPREEDIFSNVL
jgi:hypothetical protein